jgi:hypothetical protein
MHMINGSNRRYNREIHFDSSSVQNPCQKQEKLLENPVLLYANK